MFYGKLTVSSVTMQKFGTTATSAKDIPDNAVVVGVPSRVVSMDGSTGYVMNTDYGTN